MKNKKKIAALIIWYNPLIKYLENIKSLSENVDKIFIVDNSEERPIKLIEKLSKDEKINYHFFGNNRGIGYALNFGIKKAMNEDFEYILTLDQDSIINKLSLNHLIKILEENKNCAFSCPFIINKYFTKKPQVGKQYDVNVAMTSGSLLNLNIHRKIGDFNNDFFIDYVDTDYCLRVKEKGFRIILTEDAQLFHNEANIKEIRLFGSKFYPYNHAPFRFYYKTRNLLYMRSKYLPKNYKMIKREEKVFLKTLLKALLFEKNRIQKLRMALKGVNDYRKRIIGRAEF